MASPDLARYAAFCEDKRYAWTWMLRTQRLVGRLNPHPAMTSMLEAMDRPRFVRWAFEHYRGICPADVIDAGLPAASAPARQPVAA